jgi:hypothetical protein
MESERQVYDAALAAGTLTEGDTKAPDRPASSAPLADNVELF